MAANSGSGAGAAVPASALTVDDAMPTLHRTRSIRVRHGTTASDRASLNCHYDEDEGFEVISLPMGRTQDPEHPFLDEGTRNAVQRSFGVNLVSPRTSFRSERSASFVPARPTTRLSTSAPCTSLEAEMPENGARSSKRKSSRKDSLDDFPKPHPIAGAPSCEEASISKEWHATKLNTESHIGAKSGISFRPNEPERDITESRYQNISQPLSTRDSLKGHDTGIGSPRTEAASVHVYDEEDSDDEVHSCPWTATGYRIRPVKIAPRLSSDAYSHHSGMSYVDEGFFEAGRTQAHLEATNEGRYIPPVMQRTCPNCGVRQPDVAFGVNERDFREESKKKGRLPRCLQSLISRIRRTFRRKRESRFRNHLVGRP